MYDIRPNLVIGFHGCDKSIADKLVANQAVIEKSEKPYDWLEHGMYFWENNLERAKLWARDKEQRGEIKEASVVGAVLQLGNCLDFDSKNLGLLAVYYKLMFANFEALKKPIPKNKDVKKDEHKDKLLRELDCALIEFMHEQIFSDYQREIAAYGGYSNVKLFDSTRGVFTEGGEAFPGSAIQMKNHIQICIRNFNSIKGFFFPRDEENFVTVLKEEYARKSGLA